MPTELKYFPGLQSLSSASTTQGGAKGLDLVTLPEDKEGRGIDESNCEFRVPEKKKQKSFPTTDPNLPLVIRVACWWLRAKRKRELGFAIKCRGAR